MAPEYDGWAGEDMSWDLDEVDNFLLDAWELESWYYQQATEDPHELV